MPCGGYEHGSGFRSGGGRVGQPCPDNRHNRHGTGRSAFGCKHERFDDGCNRTNDGTDGYRELDSDVICSDKYAINNNDD